MDVLRRSLLRPKVIGPVFGSPAFLPIMILVLRATTIVQIIPASTGIVEWRELVFQIWLNSDPGTQPRTRKEANVACISGC